MNAPTTTQEFENARNYYRNESLSKDVLKVMDAATKELSESGVVERALKVGDSAPDFMLSNAQGKPVRLQTLLKSGPVVVVFYRGGWCPYCNLHLRGFQRLLAGFRSAGAQLVAVSPQLPDNSLDTQAKNALEFPVLSDVGLHVAHAFGVAFKLSRPLRDLYDAFGNRLGDFNGEAGETELPMPATFVIGRDGTITFAHVEADYSHRSEPLDVLAQIQRLEPATA
jgi:peroxiredoxin